MTACHHVPPCNIPLCNMPLHATCHSMQHAPPCSIVHATMQVEAQPVPVHLRPQSQESQIVTEGCCCQANMVTNFLEFVPQLRHVQFQRLLQANHVEPAANFLMAATIQKSYGSDHQSMTAQVSKPGVSSPWALHGKMEIHGAPIGHDCEHIVWEVCLHVLVHCIKVIATVIWRCVPMCHAGNLSNSFRSINLKFKIECRIWGPGAFQDIHFGLFQLDGQSCGEERLAVFIIKTFSSTSPDQPFVFLWVMTRAGMARLNRTAGSSIQICPSALWTFRPWPWSAREPCTVQVKVWHGGETIITFLHHGLFVWAHTSAHHVVSQPHVWIVSLEVPFQEECSIAIFFLVFKNVWMTLWRHASNCQLNSWQQVTSAWQELGHITIVWQEHDKSMTRAWQEHGENMTRAWQYDKNITDVNHAFIMIFEIHMFFQAMNQVSHAPTSFTPITSLPPEAKFNSWNTCLGVSKTWGTTSRQTSKLSNLKAENLTNFQTVWGASVPESLSSSRHNQTRHRKRSSPMQVTTWNKT